MTEDWVFYRNLYFLHIFLMKLHDFSNFTMQFQEVRGGVRPEAEAAADTAAGKAEEVRADATTGKKCCPAPAE